jgi:hypothetical protein
MVKITYKILRYHGWLSLALHPLFPISIYLSSYLGRSNIILLAEEVDDKNIYHPIPGPTRIGEISLFK